MSFRVALRLVLYQGEIFRVDRSSAAVRIRDGEAWVSYGGRDTILQRGEELALAPDADFAVVSSVGSGTLVLEVLEGERECNQRFRTPVERGYGAARMPGLNR